jgi:methanogenic corrinoid protein MtbC1
MMKSPRVDIQPQQWNPCQPEVFFVKSAKSERDTRELIELAKLITLRSQDIAERVIECQEAKDRTICERYEEASKRICLRDTIYHLQYLSTALRFSSISLFESYIEWLKVLMSSLGIASEDLITNHVCIEESIEEILQPETAEQVREYLDIALERLQGESRNVVTHFAESIELSLLATQYLNTLLKGEVETAMKLILEAAQEGSSLKDLYLEVFAAAQYEVGRLWLNGEISVAQEHCCTAATQLIMSQLYPYITGREKRGLRVFLACVKGELHDMGLRILRDFFIMDGWDAVFIGSNTPSESIVNLVERTKPDLLAISVTMSYNLQELVELISLIRRNESGKDLKIVVGGNPFLLDPGLWRTVGADGHGRNAEDALAIALKLVGEKSA